MTKIFKTLTASAVALLTLVISFSLPANAQATQNIVEIASSNNNFETLTAALTAADLVDDLQGSGPFTVFAPTDAAFEALPDGVLDALLENENKNTLISILQYHVVSGSVDSSQVVTLNSATTLEGSNIDITVNGSSVVLNDNVNVTQTDIEATNGFIHVIDAVLVPSSVNISNLTSSSNETSMNATVRTGGFGAISFVTLSLVAALLIASVPLSLAKKQNNNL